MIFEKDDLEADRQIRATRNSARLAKAKQVREAFNFELSNRMVVFISTAFGVVAALFWQTAITDTIKAFIPVNGAWPYEIMVALLVTLLAVLVIFIMSSIQHAQRQGT